MPRVAVPQAGLSTESVSFHYPLHRVLAALLSTACATAGLAVAELLPLVLPKPAADPLKVRECTAAGAEPSEYVGDI